MAEEQTTTPAAETTETVEATAAPVAEATTEEAVVVEPVSDLDLIKPGMVVRVHQKIKETTPKGDERERIQVFEGTVIAKKGKDKNSATITVRKIASGVGVERIFPLRMPTIAKIEVVKQMQVRRAKLYFLRDSKKKLREKAPKGAAKVK